MNTIAKLSFLTILCLSVSSIWAGTNDLAGEISYRFTGGNTIVAVITTYTKESSMLADRDSLPFAWGDGTIEYLPLTTGLVDSAINDVKLNYYTGTHTYAVPPSSGFVVLSTTDPNRNAGTINISNSVNVAFYVEDTVWWSAQGGTNNGPVLLYPPVEYGYVGDTFFHNPAAYDVEADSLTFELVTPLQAAGRVVPGYISPDQIAPGPETNDQITIDPLNGEIIWATPKTAAIYDIAILIHEYRYGSLLSTIERDMEIIVLDDTIAQSRLNGSFTDTVITEGTPLSLPYTGVAAGALTDSLSAYSGIFLIPGSNASFSTSPSANSVSGTLTWTPGPNQYKPRETRIVAIAGLQQSTNPRTNIRAFRVTVVDSAGTTGLAELGYGEGLTVSPIPAVDNLYINSSFSFSNAMILDMTGREWPAAISGNEADISGLPAGIYLFRCTDGGKTFVRRFIKE